MSLRPDLWPAGFRAGAYALAVAVLLFLCLAPSNELPKVNFWDKAEHAVAWLVLAGIGLAFWPRRPRRIAAFAIILGGVVEVLQAVMPFGRDADVRDWLADSVAVALALMIRAALRRLSGRGAIGATM